MPPFKDLRSCLPEARDKSDLSFMITDMGFMTGQWTPLIGQPEHRVKL